MFSLLFAAALAFPESEAQAAYMLTDRFVSECTPRDAGTVRGAFAADWLYREIAAVGAPVVKHRFRAGSPKGPKDFTNLVSAFTNRADGAWTVLVSHYDTKPGTDCPGANDGASTSCLLVRFAKLLAAAKNLPGNVMLLWTDAEECMGGTYSPTDGFQGSKAAAAELKRRGYRIAGVIVLDMLGDRDLKISIPENVSPELVPLAFTAADSARLPAGTLVRAQYGVKDDHVAFLDLGFPAIDLIDFEYGSKPGLNDWWHTPADTVDKLSAGSFEKTGRLVVGMVNLLGNRQDML